MSLPTDAMIAERYPGLSETERAWFASAITCPWCNAAVYEPPCGPSHGISRAAMRVVMLCETVNAQRRGVPEPAHLELPPPLGWMRPLPGTQP